MPKIFVFDVGGVIIFHDNTLLLRRLISRMKRAPDEAALLKTIRGSGIGTGASAVSQLWTSLVSDYSWTGTYDEFLSDWSSHFLPNELMLESIRSIVAAYPIIFCSNTNREHWSALCERYDLTSLCQHAVLSFEVGVEKPDARIYARVANIFQEVAHDSFFFVDDDDENIKSAKEYGFYVHRYVDHFDFLSDLKKWSLRR
ncbi:HAD family hydrolase [Cupriavidus necator]|uniref:HAD family hydrolase n=1 Tax=Cupriavidus necator TaxID=106590 RepID=UPI0009B61F0A|nr:HAD family hydrolase [Cupriavidus necator]MDX6008083.1 HAD hydrolase-like protein [Cupriavidus necator]